MRSGHLTRHDKESILHWHIDLHKTSTEIADLLIGRHSPEQIRQFLSRYFRDFGLPPKPKIKKRITDGHVGVQLGRIASEMPHLGYRKILSALIRRVDPGTRLPGRTSVYNWLVNHGYESHQPVWQIHIRQPNKVKRVQFANEMMEKPPEFFEQIIYTDESTFRKVSTRSNTIYWIPHGTPEQDLPVRLRLQAGGFSVMFWGCMSNIGVGPLVPVEGTLNASKYKQILDHYLLPYMQALQEVSGYGRMMMQDNAPPHTAKFITKYLDRAKVPRLPWPPQSPDLNPIENIWSIMKERRDSEYPLPDSKEELIEQVMEIWNSIEPELCLVLCQSVQRRMAYVIAAGGGVLKY